MSRKDRPKAYVVTEKGREHLNADRNARGSGWWLWPLLIVLVAVLVVVASSKGWLG